MRPNPLLVGAFVLTLVIPSGTALAQCAFEHPVKARSMKVSLVQAFVPCGGSCIGPLEGTPCDQDSDCGVAGYCRAMIGGIPYSGPRAPSGTFANSGLRTCAPLTFAQQDGLPANSWRWGPKGEGTLSFKAGPDKRPVSVLNPLGSMDWRIQVKLNDITVQNGSPPVDGSHATLRLRLRLTIDDGMAGTMIEDLPLYRSGIPVVRGKIKETLSLNEILNGFGLPSLPPCSSVELLTAYVEDGYGPFAVVGGFLP